MFEVTRRAPAWLQNIMHRRGDQMIHDEGSLDTMIERYSKAIRCEMITPEIAWQMTMSSLELDDQIHTRKERDLEKAENRKRRMMDPANYKDEELSSNEAPSQMFTGGEGP